VFFAPASSTGEVTIRTQEAQLVSTFIESARKTQPLGKVIVSDRGQLANISLEQGDKIVIPSKSDLIQIGGEVLMPQAVVYNPEAQFEDYIAWAGGYTARANYDNIILVHANGLSEFINIGGNFMTQNDDIKLVAGDKIIVLPLVETKSMQAVKDITQILFQIAIAANAIK
jgi:hypothetical protein